MLEDPQIRPFLPILHLAWSDGDLTDDELRAVRERVSASPWLDAKARTQLESWLDPAAPPSPATLDGWLEAVRTSSATLAPEERASLGAMAKALAPEGTADGAFDAVIDALGLDPQSAASLLTPAEAAPAPTHERRFDPAKLQAVLEPSWPEARALAREFLAEPEHRLDRTRPYAERRERTLELLQKLADAGAGRLAFPGVTSDAPDMGGFMAIFETLGLGDLDVLVKLGVHFGLFGGSIFFLGTEKHHATYMEDVATMKLPGCFAMTELGHGSNVMGLETTATYDPETDEIVVHTPSESARKEWIGNAALHAKMATVFAQLVVDGKVHGVHAILVRIRDDEGNPAKGVRLGDCGYKLGLNGVDNGRIWFDQVRVPRANLLDRYGRITDEGAYESPIPSKTKRFFTMLGTLVAGRVCVGSGSVSASKVGMTIALRYAASRRQFGEPGNELRLWRYPAHRRRLVPFLAQTFGAHFAIARARNAFLAGEFEGDERAVETLAAAAKIFGTDHATASLQACREACGGQGYLSANRIGPLKSDSDVFTTFEGDNTVLLQLVAKARLSDFKRQFRDARVMGVLRFVAEKAGRHWNQSNPIARRLRTEEHLRSRDFLHGALELRESSLVESVARRMKSRMDGGMEVGEAFLDLQNHVLSMSKAYVERLVYDAFAEGVASAKDPAVKAALDRCLDLWALWRIEADVGWYLENAIFESQKATAIRDEVEQLIDEVAEDALTLTEGFAIPDACLAAPIAFLDPAERLR